jgi:hypothetical protein
MVSGLGHVIFVYLIYMILSFYFSFISIYNLIALYTNALYFQGSKSLIEAKSKYLAHLCMPTHFAGSITKSGGVKLAKPNLNAFNILDKILVRYDFRCMMIRVRIGKWTEDLHICCALMV